MAVAIAVAPRRRQLVASIICMHGVPPGLFYLGLSPWTSVDPVIRWPSGHAVVASILHTRGAAKCGNGNRVNGQGGRTESDY